MSGTSSRHARNPKSTWSRYEITVTLSPQSSKIGPERVDRDQLRAREVERPRRPGHVRHDEVDDGPQPLADAQARVRRASPREQRRRGESRPSPAASCGRPPRARPSRPTSSGRRRARARPDRRSRPAAPRTSTTPGCRTARRPRPAPTSGSTRPAACRAARRGARDSVRSAPAVTASTTSLTVTPNAFFTAFTSASDTDENAIDAVRGDRAVHRQPRRGQRQRDVRAPRRARGGRRARRRARGCVTARTTLRRAAARATTTACAEHLGVARHAVGRPLVGAARTRLERRVGVEVEQRGDDRDAGDAVDQRVVDLRDERLVAVLEAFDDVRLPQRLAAVERPARDVGRERRELARSARRGQRGAAHVVVEVEVGILDPRRHVRAERHLDEAAPERRHEVEARLEQGVHPVVERLARSAGHRSTDRRPRCP